MPISGRVSSLFDSLDTNNSGTLELSELIIVCEQDRADMFRYLDLDG